MERNNLNYCGEFIPIVLPTLIKTRKYCFTKPPLTPTNPYSNIKEIIKAKRSEMTTIGRPCLYLMGEQ